MPNMTSAGGSVISIAIAEVIMSDIISALGAGSGLDTKSLVEGLVKAEREPRETQLNNREQTLDAKISAYGQVKSSLSQLREAFAALDDARDFNFATLASSNPSILGAEVDQQLAQAGQHRIEIKQLAQSDIWASMTVTDPAADQNSGDPATFSFQVGDGSWQDVSLAAGEASLNKLAEGINAKQAGVSARVVDVGEGDYRLLVESASGSDNSLSFDDDVFDIDNDHIQSAEDARLILNGLEVTRSSNQIDDLIPGIKLNLIDVTDKKEEVVLGVSRNETAAEQVITNVMTAYNEFEKVVGELGRYGSASEEGGVLATDATLRTIRRQFRDLLMDKSSGAGSHVARLSDMGISVDRYGVFQTDSTKLKAALSDRYDEVVAFFSATTDDQSAYSADPRGLAGDLVKTIDRFLAADGVVTQHEKTFDSLKKRIGDEKTRLDERMVGVEARYQQQFITMERIINEINSIGDYLDGQFNSPPFVSSDD